MEQTYKYDAFISYRHTPLDMKIAELIHTKIEAFKTPKGYKKIERIFRDRDELPTSSNLAKSILDALTHSRYLIVVCSPRTGLSKWVLKEIEIFRELHGNDRILSILIEGEPIDAFPKSLRLIPYTTTDDSGVETINYEVVEPLAADIRATSLRGMKKKINTEILRLLAPLYGCNYDDLKQRQRKRVKRRAVILTTTVMIIGGFIGLFSFWQLRLLDDKNDQLAVNEQLLIETSELLHATNNELTQKNEENVISALNDEGIYIGSNELWLEGIPKDSFLIRDFLAADFVVSDIDNRYIITNDSYDSVHIYDFETRELRFTLPYVDDNYIGAKFILDTNYVIILSDNTATLINLDTFSIEKEYVNEDANTIGTSNDGTYLVDIDNYNETISIINPMTMLVMNTYTNEGYGNSSIFSADNLYTFIHNDKSLLSIHIASGSSHLFQIDEYSNVAIDHYKTLTAVVKDLELIIYDYTSGQEIYHSGQLAAHIISLSFLPNGEGLLMSNENGTLFIIDLNTYETRAIDVIMDSPFNHYIYDNDGIYMVTWDVDSEQAMLWDLNLMKEIAHIPYFFGIAPDFKTIYGYEAFNLYGMNRESLEHVFSASTD